MGEGVVMFYMIAARFWLFLETLCFFVSCWKVMGRPMTTGAGATWCTDSFLQPSLLAPSCLLPNDSPTVWRQLSSLSRCNLKYSVYLGLFLLFILIFYSKREREGDKQSSGYTFFSANSCLKKTDLLCYVYFLCSQIYVCVLCVWVGGGCHWRPEEGIRSPVDGVTDGCEPLDVTLPCFSVLIKDLPLI